MMLAALDALYDTIVEIANSSTEENAIERLRQISRTHVAYASSHLDEFMSPFLAFVTSDASDGFREQLNSRSQAATQTYVAIIEQGKAQGTVRGDVDADQAAWELIAAYWANAVGHAVGLKQLDDKQRTIRMVDFIIDGMSTDSRR